MNSILASRMIFIHCDILSRNRGCGTSKIGISEINNGAARTSRMNGPSKKQQRRTRRRAVRTHGRTRHALVMACPQPRPLRRVALPNGSGRRTRNERRCVWDYLQYRALCFPSFSSTSRAATPSSPARVDSTSTPGQPCAIGSRTICTCGNNREGEVELTA